MNQAPESLLTVLGTVYSYRKTSDGGDLYLTRFGVPHAAVLDIENWYERSWFEEHRERLEGTSAVYKVPTRTIDGKSLDLVVKYCRVGEDIPFETRTFIEFINTDFNSPWEEFSLVMELSESKWGVSTIPIATQEPLAIYVPPEKMQLWQSGRSHDKINRIRTRHPGVDLDILRQYILVYAWIKGENIVHVLNHMQGDKALLSSSCMAMTQNVIDNLEKRGYVVADMKPAHVIVHENDVRRIEALHGVSTESTAGQLRSLQELIDKGDYSIVDYELLMRTPAYEEVVSSVRRHSYLDYQRDRFIPTELPPHLNAEEIYSVPYVHGHVESTDGQLWVVGRNGRLFDYFLPERWRKTHFWKLSETNEVFYTVTKDHIHIVWKTSRVGETPLNGPDDRLAPLAREYGFNSPFEEFAFALDLRNNGVPVVYVRAIYRTGILKLEQSTDLRRFGSHRNLCGPNGMPILDDQHNYITIRGYYNGPDRWVAQQKGSLYRPMDLTKALTASIIDHSEYNRLFNTVHAKLKNAGYDGSLLKGNDLIMALDATGAPVKDEKGRIEVRICNFELLIPMHSRGPAIGLGLM